MLVDVNSYTVYSTEHRRFSAKDWNPLVFRWPWNAVQSQMLIMLHLQLQLPVKFYFVSFSCVRIVLLCLLFVLCWIVSLLEFCGSVLPLPTTIRGPLFVHLCAVVDMTGPSSNVLIR